MLLLNTYTAPIGLRAGDSGYVEVAPGATIELSDSEAKDTFVVSCIANGDLLEVKKPAKGTGASEPLEAEGLPKVEETLPKVEETLPTDKAKTK